MKERKLRVGVLVSGSGTNLQAIIDACESGAIHCEISVVVSNHAGARALVRASDHGIKGVHIDRGAYPSVHDYNAAIRDIFAENITDIVVMAGYMRLLGKEVLDAFPEAVINLHPALLPSFPGASGIRDAFEHGVKVTGVTVHFADEVFDRGPIIAQEPVLIAEDDTVESLEAKIHAVEHELLPRVIGWIAEDRLRVEGRRVRVAAQAG